MSSDALDTNEAASKAELINKLRGLGAKEAQEKTVPPQIVENVVAAPKAAQEKPTEADLDDFLENFMAAKK